MKESPVVRDDSAEPHARWIHPLARIGRHPGRLTMSQSGPIIPGIPGPLQRLARDAWQAVLLIGISAVLLGAVALGWPGKTLVVLAAPFSSIGVLTVFAGVWLIVTGFAEINSSLRIRSHAT
jgi:hypothetical protein